MDKLLQSDFINYLKKLNPNVLNVQSVRIKDVRTDVTYDTNFDIQDLRPTIIQRIRYGSATYNNPNNKLIAIVDYEDFLNKQPQQHIYPANKDVIKRLGLKKLDFIIYDLGTNSFFILNELSQSGNPNNKRKEAFQQLHNALMHFYQIPAIKSFIGTFTDKRCVFSNRSPILNSPNAIANSFGLINTLLPTPKKGGYGPIINLGFSLIETDIIDV